MEKSPSPVLFQPRSQGFSLVGATGGTPPLGKSPGNEVGTFQECDGTTPYYPIYALLSVKWSLTGGNKKPKKISDFQLSKSITMKKLSQS